MKDYLNVVWHSGNNSEFYLRRSDSRWGLFLGDLGQSLQCSEAISLPLKYRWHLAYIIHRITVNIKLELVSKRVLVIVKCYCKCELVYYSLTQKEITYIQSAKYVLSAELLTLYYIHHHYQPF